MNSSHLSISRYTKILKSRVTKEPIDDEKGASDEVCSLLEDGK